MSIIVLYCKEDKNKIFFKVDGKSKQDLCRILKNSLILRLSDDTKQYHSVEKIISSS